MRENVVRFVSQTINPNRIRSIILKNKFLKKIDGLNLILLKAF